MNRLLFSLMAVAILSAPAAHAQRMGTMHHERADSAEHAQMMARLNLTEAQKTQIKAIHDKYSAQMNGDHKQSGMAGMDSMHMNPTMKQAMAEVRAVLTPEQQSQFDAMVAEHESKHHAMDDSTSHHNMKMPPGSMRR